MIKREQLLQISVFGSVAWVHIDKDERQKHEERAELGIYVGEPEYHGKSTHKVYLVASGVIVPTRHVEIWDGIFLAQVMNERKPKIPQGPVTPLKDLGKGPSILVEYDRDAEMLKLKQGATVEDHEEMEDKAGAEAERDLTADEKAVESTRREGEATERYLKSNKRP